MTLYLLPDGSLVPVDSTAAKDAPIIDYQLKSGQIVPAKRVEPASYAVRKALREATLKIGREKEAPIHESREATAQHLAEAIRRNCDAYHAHEITETVWDAEQVRLWQIAGESFCAARLMQLVCPSLSQDKTS